MERHGTVGKHSNIMHIPREESHHPDASGHILQYLCSYKGSNRSELIEAEKTAVLNQILYIVRNMILFYSEKEVKEFTNKFVKLLKQDDRFLKDVHVNLLLT